MLAQFSLFLLLFFPIPKFALFSSKIISEGTFESHKELAKCAVFVTERYIKPKTNTVVVRERCSNCKNVIRAYNQNLLDYYLLHLDAMMSIQLFLGQSNEQPWNYYIFIVDDLFAFKELRSLISYNLYEREFFFLIILTQTSGSPELRRYIMLEILRNCVLLKVLHVVIMELEHENANSISFYTYQSSGAYCFENIDILRINRFQDGVLDADYLFLPDIFNFHKCTLNVTAFLFQPWLGFNGNIDNINHTRDVSRLTGIDGDHMKLISQTLNFSVNLRFKAERGVIKLEENSTGCFADLEAGAADIAIGGFSVALTNQSKLSASIPYRSTAYVFLVRSNLHFGPLKQLANPFHSTVWLAIGLTILLAFAIIKAINHSANAILRAFLIGTQNHYPNTNLLTILLGSSVLRPPRRNFARFLLMSWLLLTLILRNAYQGMLFDSLRVSRRSPAPAGVTALIQHNYKLLSSVYVDYYPENLTIIIPSITDQINEVMNSESRVTTTSALETLGYYNFMYRDSSRLSCVKDIAHVLHLTMYFQKHSALKLIFDKKINQLRYSGITSHWTKKPFERNEFRLMYAESRKLPCISNEMLQGLYVMYWILINITMICFVLEKLTQKIAKLKRIFDLVHNQAEH